jgi:hypothetical protein
MAHSSSSFFAPRSTKELKPAVSVGGFLDLKLSEWCRYWNLDNLTEPAFVGYWTKAGEVGSAILDPHSFDFFIHTNLMMAGV